MSGEAPKKLRIGELLVANKIITEEQLETALGEQKKLGLKLGRTLIELGYIDEGSLAVDLQVDGGISPSTIGDACSAGANVFVAGTAVFGQNDYASAISTLKQRAVES